MRYSLKEGVLFGVIIGAAALLIRTFVGGPLLYQLLALVVVAVVLAVAQFMLSLRRARPHDQTTTPSRPERPRSPRRARPQDPFAREKNQAWTGLSSTTVQEQEQRERAGALPSEKPSSEASPRAPEPTRDAAPPTNHRQS